MKQYCRYCSFCFEADDLRCSNHPSGKQVHLSENDIKRENHCKNFALSDLGDVITGKQYRPRSGNKKSKEAGKFEQISLFEVN